MDVPVEEAFPQPPRLLPWCLPCRRTTTAASCRKLLTRHFPQPFRPPAATISTTTGCTSTPDCSEVREDSDRRRRQRRPRLLSQCRPAVATTAAGCRIICSTHLRFEMTTGFQVRQSTQSIHFSA